MVDTGATVPPITKKWCETHEVDYMPVKNCPVVQTANGHPLNLVGTASFTVKFSPSLEIDLEGVIVHDVQGSCAVLIGMDLLNGQKEY